MSELEVPEGWTKLDNLGDVVAKLESGKRPSGGVNNILKGIPSIGGEHLNYNGKFNLQNVKFVPTDFFKNMNRGKINQNDILIVKDGATTGKTSFVDEKFPYDQACVNEHVFIMRPNEKILSKLLYYFIRSDFAQKQIREKTKGDIGGINLTFINNFPIVFPKDKKHQEKIIKKIDTILGEIENKKNEIIILQKKSHYISLSEQFFLYYLRQAFSGKITGETKFEQTADDYLKDYITKHKILGLKPLHSIEMYSIPNGWKWITIEQISEIVRGASPRPAGDPLYFGGDIPWFTVGSITKDDNMYLYDGHGFLTTSGKDHSRFISPETLLLTNSGATLGVPKITKVSGCINDGSVALLYIPPTLQKYLYYYLKMLTAKLRRINQGAAQPNLNTSIVKAIPFPLSPLEHQEKIVNYLDSNFSNILKKKQFIFKLKSNQKDLISKINKLEKSILNFAFLEKLT